MSGSYRHAATTLKSAFSARSVAIRQKMPRLMKPGQVEHHEHLVCILFLSLLQTCWLTDRLWTYTLNFWCLYVCFSWAFLIWKCLIAGIGYITGIKILKIWIYCYWFVSCLCADVPPSLPHGSHCLRHFRCCRYWIIDCCPLRKNVLLN